MTTTIPTSEGDILISDTGIKQYKEMYLLGENAPQKYEKINLNFVRLIEKVQAIVTSGVEEIEFNINSYIANEDVKRTNEFKIWKSSLLELVESSISNSLFDLNKIVQQEINDRTNQYNKLNEIVQKIPTDLDDKLLSHKNNLVQSFDLLFQTKLEGINNTLNGFEESLTTATQEFINKSKEFTTAKSEFHQQTETFINGVNQQLETFVTEINKSTTNEVDLLNKSVNEQIQEINKLFSELKAKQNELDNTLKSYDFNSIQQEIQTVLIEKVNTEITETLSSTTLKIENLQNNFTDLEELLADEINNITNNTKISLEDLKNTVNQQLTSVAQNNQALSNLIGENKTSIQNLQDAFNNFKNEALEKEVEISHENNMNQEILISVKEYEHLKRIELMANNLQNIINDLGNRIHNIEQSINISNEESIYDRIKFIHDEVGLDSLESYTKEVYTNIIGNTSELGFSEKVTYQETRLIKAYASLVDEGFIGFIAVIGNNKVPNKIVVKHSTVTPITIDLVQKDVQTIHNNFESEVPETNFDAYQREPQFIKSQSRTNLCIVPLNTILKSMLDTNKDLVINIEFLNNETVLDVISFTFSDILFTNEGGKTPSETIGTGRILPYFEN